MTAQTPAADEPEPPARTPPSKADRSARWWTATIHALIDEIKTVPGKINASTIAILAGMWIMATFAVLGELLFKMTVNLEWLKVSMGGDPVPIVSVWAFMLLTWLSVAYFCTRTYLDTIGNKQRD